MRGTDKFFKVKYSAKIKFSRLPFVQVPAHVSFDRVQAALPGFQQAVFPQFREYPEIMDGAGNNLFAFAVDKDFSVFYIYFFHENNSIFI